MVTKRDGAARLGGRADHLPQGGDPKHHPFASDRGTVRPAVEPNIPASVVPSALASLGRHDGGRPLRPLYRACVVAAEGRAADLVQGELCVGWAAAEKGKRI